MPAIIFQIILAVLPIIKILIEKFVPSKVTRKRDFYGKKKMLLHVDKFTTIAELATMKNDSKS